MVGRTALLLLLALAVATAEEHPLAQGTKWRTSAFVTRAARPGPTVVIVGGIHGDEAAGRRAAEQIRHWRIERGTLVVIPSANRLGGERGKRRVPDDRPYDLNRRFPSKPDTPVRGPLARDIWKLVAELEPDWLVDLHESRDYRYRSTPRRKTLGNTLICPTDAETLRMASRLVTVPQVADPRREWRVLHDPIEGSLARAAATRLGAHAFIAETSKRNYLAIRVRFHRQIVHRLLVELKMIPEERAAETCFPPARKPGEIRVAIYNCAGTGGDSAYVVERCLVPFARASCRRITDAAIRQGALGQFDVVVFPGGTGSGIARALGDAGRREVRRFVRDGGGYLGICAGAYLATSHYRWSLGILDASVVDSEHWARGNGMARIGLTKKGAALFDAREKSLRISYRQGPLLAPGGQAEIEDFELLASYESEIAKKGVPRGVMIGTAAIVRGRFGDGRVIAMSPHPEKTKGLAGFVRSAVAWLGGDPAR